MPNRWEELRNKVNNMSEEGLREIMLAVIDELERISGEIRQGFYRPE